MKKLSLLLLLVVILVSGCTSATPTTQVIEVKKIVTPVPAGNYTPNNPEFYLNSDNISRYYHDCKDLPKWIDYSGITYSTKMTSKMPDEPTWNEGRFTGTFTTSVTEIQINDRIVKFPSLNVVQVVPYVSDGETRYKEVQELKPEEYQKHATELLDGASSFSFTTTFTWAIDVNHVDNNHYTWLRSCTISK